MTTNLAISQYFSGLAEVRAQFPIEPAIAEKERCDPIKYRYLYHRDRSPHPPLNLPPTAHV